MVYFPRKGGTDAVYLGVALVQARIETFPNCSDGFSERRRHIDKTFAFMPLRSTLLTMSDFDIDAFITEVERLGLKLSATRLLDGTYRVNRWRMPDAILNAQQIEDLWAKHIGDDKARMSLLGTHLARRPSNRGPSDK